MRKAAILASAAMLVVAAGCHSLSHDASPAELVYAHGFADDVASAGPQLSRELALFRAQREAAKLQAVRGIQFTYQQLGDPQSLKLDFLAQADAKVAGSRVLGNSLWLVLAVRRSADVLTLMDGMVVARASVTVRDMPLGQAYEQALHLALAKVIEAFASRSAQVLPSPLKGTLTLVALDVDQPRLGGLRVTVEANADIAAVASEDSRTDPSLDEAKRLREAGDLEGAAAALRQLIERTPTVAKYYEELGDVYFDMEQLHWACWAYGMAASFDPTNPEYHLAVGEAYQFMGDAKEAERAYAKAIEMDPTCSVARTALKLLRRSASGRR